MKIYQKIALASVLSAVIFNAYAAPLPAIPDAGEITTGEFLNGIKYYLVKNPASFGTADFALVQNCHTEESKLRGTLEGSRHFKSPTPYGFLLSRGVGYSRNGFVDSRRSSTVYRFENFPMTDAYGVDSLLMMIFDFCELCPSSQAIIISGDISPDEMKGKMSIFSMTVPPREEFKSANDYEWVPMENLTFVERTNNNRSASTIRATWSVPRTKDSALKDITVYSSHLLYGEMKIILDQRIRDAFRSAGVPLAEVGIDFVGSAETEGDESFSVSVCVGKDKIEKASSLLGQVLAGLDLFGARAAELSYAHSVYLEDLRKKSKYGIVSDKEYVERCMSAYLFGTDLSTSASEYEYVSNKDLTDLKNLELFNAFSSALIDPSCNLVLEFDTPLEYLDRTELTSAFTMAWNSKPQDLAYSFKRIQPLDSLAHGFPKRATKLKSEVADPITGGILWTFSNGLKVIFKRTAGSKDFNYAVMVRGGYPTIKAIGEGEGAFVSDIMDFYNIPHFNCNDMARLFRREGIDFDTRISISDMRITGKAEAEKYKYVLAAILSYSVLAKPNTKAFDYYCDCEPLRIDNNRNQGEGIEAEIDRIMRPDYLFSQYKYAENLSDDLQSKTVPYVRDQFSRFGEGMMVFAGDVEEYEILDWFKKYGGYFRAERHFTARPQAQYILVSGEETYVRKVSEGQKEGVYVMNSTIVPVTAERYLSFRIACTVLQRELSRRLGDYGYYCEVDGRYETYPQERITILTSCHPVSRGGLPLHVRSRSPQQVLKEVKQTLMNAGHIILTDAEIEALKASLLREMAFELSSSGAKLEIALTRYSEGKDIMSRYAEVMKLVSSDKISETLSTLTSDCSVELLVER